MPELEPEYRQIGDAMRRLRRERDLSQQAVADACRISRSALANIEAGQQRVAVHVLLAIAKALRVEPSALLPASGARLQSLDKELVQRGVPEQAARVVARLMSENEREDVASSAGQG